MHKRAPVRMAQFQTSGNVGLIAFFTGAFTMYMTCGDGEQGILFGTITAFCILAGGVLNYSATLFQQPRYDDRDRRESMEPQNKFHKV